jgi:hypothetical protein
MISIQACKTDEAYAVAARLVEGLCDWDRAETEKLGIAAPGLLDVYYAAQREPPAAWKPPAGLMLLGYAQADAVGCVAYRSLEPGGPVSGCNRLSDPEHPRRDPWRAGASILIVGSGLPVYAWYSRRLRRASPKRGSK